MRVVVRQGALKPLLLDTKEATSLEIRDDQGNALYSIFLIPGPQGSGSFFTSTINDSDFNQFLSTFGIPPNMPPPELK